MRNEEGLPAKAKELAEIFADIQNANLTKSAKIAKCHIKKRHGKNKGRGVRN